MLSFVCSAFTLSAVGLFCVFEYPFNKDETMKLPDLTVPDLERVVRLMRLKMALMHPSSALAFLILAYTLLSVVSILILWVHFLLENSPEVKQELLKKRQALELARQRRAQEQLRRREAQDELNRQQHQERIEATD
jgi:sensor histidine kinase YesM